MSMNVQLTTKDKAMVRAIQAHFSNIEPIGVSLGNVDVLRIGLQMVAKKLELTEADISMGMLETATLDEIRAPDERPAA